MLLLDLTQRVCLSGCLRLQATPYVSLSPEEVEALTKRTQDGGTEVVQAKAGKVRAEAKLGAWSAGAQQRHKQPDGCFVAAATLITLTATFFAWM